MSCEEFRTLISARLDGELTDEQRRRLEEHLAGCAACTRELAELGELKEQLAMIRFREPTDAELDRYWHGVYNRLERGLGWILASLGAMLLLCYGGFRLIESVIRDPAVAWMVKIGLAALLVGVVVLFVSVLRERLTVRGKDKYSREVER